MRANTTVSITKQSSTLNVHSSSGGFVSGPPEGSALSTGGALLD